MFPQNKSKAYCNSVNQGDCYDKKPNNSNSPLTQTKSNFPWISPYFPVIFTRLTQTRTTQIPCWLELKFLFLDRKVTEIYLWWVRLVARLQVGQAFGVFLLPWLGVGSSSPQVPYRHPPSICDSGIKLWWSALHIILTPFPCTGTGELPLAVFKVRPTVTHKNWLGDQFRMIMPYYHMWDVMVTFYATMWQTWSSARTLHI